MKKINIFISEEIRMKIVSAQILVKLAIENNDFVTLKMANSQLLEVIAELDKITYEAYDKAASKGK